MLVVWAKIRSTSSETSCSRASTCKVCAGRPFFIRIGVSQASAAPPANSAVSVGGHNRGSRSSTLVSITVISSGRGSSAGLSSGLPITRRQTFARSGGSALPAPTPIAVTVIAGTGPNARPSATATATPVGVACSRAPWPPAAMAPESRSSSSTAGTGTGSVPWAVCAVPPPSVIGPQAISVTPSAAKPATVPTMSAMLSRAPTSWKCTSSTGTPCTRPSARANRQKTAMACSATPAGSSARSRSPRISLRWRAGLSGADVTIAWVARKPARRTSWLAIEIRWGRPNASTALWITDSGAPASKQAPSSMSPLMPPLASIQARVGPAFAGAAWSGIGRARDQLVHRPRTEAERVDLHPIEPQHLVGQVWLGQQGGHQGGIDLDARQ